MKKKEVLVVGAGFSGLAVACQIQETGLANVTIFDGNKPYEKASMIASGIIHPFPGQNARVAKSNVSLRREWFQACERDRRGISSHTAPSQSHR